MSFLFVKRQVNRQSTRLPALMSASVHVMHWRWSSRPLPRLHQASHPENFP